MFKLELSKPNKKEALVIILGLLLLALLFENLELINLFSKNSERGFFYDYQNLIGGLFAFGAGYFVWISAKIHISFEEKKEKEVRDSYRFYYAKEARMISVHSQQYIKEISKDKKSETQILFIKKFREKFLLDLNHISYFSKYEIWRLSDLENELVFTNQFIETLEGYSKIHPEIAFRDIYNITSTVESMNSLSVVSGKLSSSLDRERWDNWFKKK